jgi:hypothetical protein
VTSFRLIEIGQISEDPAAFLFSVGQTWRWRKQVSPNLVKWCEEIWHLNQHYNKLHSHGCGDPKCHTCVFFRWPDVIVPGVIYKSGKWLNWDRITECLFIQFSAFPLSIHPRFCEGSLLAWATWCLYKELYMSCLRIVLLCWMQLAFLTYVVSQPYEVQRWKVPPAVTLWKSAFCYTAYILVSFNHDSSYCFHQVL